MNRVLWFKLRQKGQTRNRLAMVRQVTSFMKSLRTFPFPCPPILSFTLLPIISFPHLPIISEGWSATYHVDATSGNAAGPLIPSASPMTVLSGLNAFTVSITWYHCTSLPLLPTHQVPLVGGITRAPARLDSRPVANGFLGRISTYKTTRLARPQLMCDPLRFP
jgi:hypothetical protein